MRRSDVWLSGATRWFLAAGAVAVLLQSPAAAQLTKAQQKCADGFIKGSANVLKTVDKSVGKCAAAMSKGTTPGPLVDCVMSGPTSAAHIAKVEMKVSATVLKNCSIPYPMDCPAPCDATDAGGATTGIDDDAELTACLQCFNIGNAWSASAPTGLKGVYGAITEGATIYSSSTPGASCQQAMIKAVAHVYETKIFTLVGCVKKAFANGTPPANCLASLQAVPKVASVIAGLGGKTIPAKCPAGPPFAFDSGVCGNLDGNALASCLDAVIECRVCRWGNTLTGQAVDCDLFDDALANGSC
jgi:hypothetical protein